MVVPKANRSADVSELARPATVTLMSTTPTPAGLTTVQLTVLEQPTDAAGLDPNFTAVSPGVRPNADPTSVTVGPPVSEPKFGGTRGGGHRGRAAPSQSLPQPEK